MASLISTQLKYWKLSRRARMTKCAQGSNNERNQPIEMKSYWKWITIDIEFWFDILLHLECNDDYIWSSDVSVMKRQVNMCKIWPLTFPVEIFTNFCCCLLYDRVTTYHLMMNNSQQCWQLIQKHTLKHWAQNWM